MESPNYPADYPDNVDCYWYCTGLPSTNMNITLAEFVIEEGSDFVTLYDGLTLLSPPMLQLTRNYTNDTTKFW